MIVFSIRKVQLLAISRFCNFGIYTLIQNKNINEKPHGRIMYEQKNPFECQTSDFLKFLLILPKSLPFNKKNCDTYTFL